jgi:hypothetical protein
MSDETITCVIRYRLDLARIEAFELYAKAWIDLINRHGGRHHGYFLPTEGPQISFSFPGLGREGPGDVAIALFSFPSADAYHDYRLSVAQDPDCARAEAVFRESNCFLDYERSFMRKLEAE